MDGIIEIFKALVIPVWYLGWRATETLRGAGFSPNPAEIVFIALIAVVFVGSGFAAASVAEQRNRSRLTHALLGLLLPILYPLAAMALMSQKPWVEKKQEMELGTGAIAPPKLPSRMSLPSRSDSSRMVEFSIDDPDVELEEPTTSSNPREADKSSEDAQPGATDDGSLGGGVDKHFISSLMVDDSGIQIPGPFVFEMEDGTILEVNKIVKPQDTVVVVEIADGDASSTLRIPYARVRDARIQSA